MKNQIWFWLESQLKNLLEPGVSSHPNSKTLMKKPGSSSTQFPKMNSSPGWVHLLGSGTAGSYPAIWVPRNTDFYSLPNQLLFLSFWNEPFGWPITNIFGT